MRCIARMNAGVVVLLLASLIGVDPCPAQDAAPPQKASEPKSEPASTVSAAEPAAPPARGAFDLRTTDRLTGDWGGARTRLEEEGVQFNIKVLNEWMVNAHGGREVRNGNDFGGSYDVDLRLNLVKLLDLKGASFFVRTKGTWGAEVSDFDSEKIGGLFRTNADAGTEEPIFIDKWHYAQKLWDDRLEFRAGRIDIVKDLFDLSVVMGDEDTKFLNRALVRNGTIPPEKALGVYADAKLTKIVYARAAVVDSESRERQTNFNTAFHGSDHFRVYAEAGIRPEFDGGRGKLKGVYRVGTWYDPNRKSRFFDDRDGQLAQRYETGDWGFFTGFDQMIWKENQDAKDAQGLTIAGRYGWARASINRMEHFWAVAVAYEGLIPQRDKDVIGVGVAQGLISEDFRQHENPRADRETVFEAYYSWQATPWMTISPDFQYIADPGGTEAGRDATVFGIRVKMAL